MKTWIIKNGTKNVAEDSAKAMDEKLEKVGVKLITSDEIKSVL